MCYNYSVKNVDVAKKLLVGDKTCILVKGDEIIESEERGIKPMMALISNATDLSGFSVADKIVGKAAAMLFVLAQIEEVYAEVISEKGIKILEEHSIPYSYLTKTDSIINRKGDDICPMEKTVMEIDNPKEAYEALYQKIRSL